MKNIALLFSRNFHTYNLAHLRTFYILAYHTISGGKAIVTQKSVPYIFLKLHRKYQLLLITFCPMICGIDHCPFGGYPIPFAFQILPLLLQLFHESTKLLYDTEYHYFHPFYHLIRM